jgi:hypothetical protein
MDSKDNKQLKSENDTNILIMSSDRGYMYSVFHTLMVFFALYLTFRCKRYGNTQLFLEIVAAIVCPYFYIMWILVNHGTCDIIPGEVRD